MTENLPESVVHNRALKPRQMPNIPNITGSRLVTQVSQMLWPVGAYTFSSHSSSEECTGSTHPNNKSSPGMVAKVPSTGLQIKGFFFYFFFGVC